MKFMDAKILVKAGFVLLLVGLSNQSWALELTCKHIAPIQQRFLARHVGFSKLDKNIETRTIERFVKTLDSSKIYFTQDDVNKIKKSLDGVFIKLREKEPDCSALYAARDLMKERVKENILLAQSYLGKNFKFEPKTRITLDAQKRSYAKTKNEKEEYQKRYVQLQVANYIATDLKETEAKDKVIKNYERALKRMNDDKPNDVIVSFLDSYATALDPHSTYWSSDAFEEFEIGIRLSLEGIGATLSSKDGFTVVEQLIPGGSAERSGLVNQKDKIVAVAQGDDGEFEDVIDLELRDVVKKIRGKKGSKVRLKILRKEAEGMKSVIVSLVRDKINIEDETASIDYIDKEINGKIVKVGLVNLPTFYADTRAGEKSSASDMKKLMKEARENKVDTMVLDLSSNGGGSLQDAVEIAGLFFREGNVVKQMGRNQNEAEILSDKDPMVDYSGPLVVLTSRISASASEIVAGTLQDYRRAVVVGADHTYGKGTIQAVENLPPRLGALKTTIGMYFIPGGNSTQHIGVSSDIPLPSVFTTEEFGEKTQDYSLPPKKISPFLSAEAVVPNGVGAWSLVDKKIIDKLKATSSARVKKDPEFKKIYDDIAKVKKRGDSGAIVLAEFLKDREKSTQEDKEDEGKTYQQTKLARKERYMKRADVQEAMNIAAELALLQNPGKEYRLGSKGTSKSAETQVKPSSNN